MSSAQRAYYPEEWRQEEPPTRVTGRPTTGEQPAGALDRRAVPMNRRELQFMAFIVLAVVGIMAMTVLYLAAFATGSVQTRRGDTLQRQIGQAELTNGELEAEIARLMRRERIEREAERLGLARVEPTVCDPLEVPGAVAGAAPVDVSYVDYGESHGRPSTL